MKTVVLQFVVVCGSLAFSRSQGLKGSRISETMYVSGFGLFALRPLLLIGKSSRDVFNPFTAPACKMSGLKSAHIHACKQCI